MKRILLLLGCVTMLSLSTVSCDKYLDIEPEGKIIPKTVEDYKKFLRSGYVQYPKHKSLTTLRTDEVKFVETDNEAFLGIKDIYIYNDFAPSSQTKVFPYTAFYTSIFYANSTIIEGGKTMEAGNEKDQLIGEAYALRAYSYFELVNLYAKSYDTNTAKTELGIVLQNELDIENKGPKSTIEAVYNQIHADLNLAKEYLKVSNFDNKEKYHFTIPAVYALESRVNLYQKNYQAAIESAEKAMTYRSALQNLNTDSKIAYTDYSGVENMMALDDAFSTQERNITYVSSELINAFDKENDLRFLMSFQLDGENYRVIKTGDGNTKVSFRTAELYMNKAEALVQLNQLSEAKNTLEQLIVSRYKPEAAATILQKLTGLNQEQFLAFILEERYKEFAFEGHRWNDLRRLDQKQIVHQLGEKEYILKQNDPRYTLPFPLEAKRNNPNL